MACRAPRRTAACSFAITATAIRPRASASSSACSRSPAGWPGATAAPTSRSTTSCRWRPSASSRRSTASTRRARRRSPRTRCRRCSASSSATSATEVAHTLGIGAEQVLEAMEAAGAYDAVSLEAYRFGDEGDGETYAESIGVEDGRFELVEYGATIAPTLAALPARDRIVLHLRFVEDLTQAEIAERVGVSQMHVSRLIRRALERLRTVAEHSG